MKFSKKIQRVYGWQSLFALILFITGIITHDWFWLAAAFVGGGNLYRVVNYEGHEE